MNVQVLHLGVALNVERNGLNGLGFQVLAFEFLRFHARGVDISVDLKVLHNDCSYM